MDKGMKQNPQLIVLATDAQAVKARFGGWPDLLLPESVLRQLADDPKQLPQEMKAALLRRGLLLTEGTSTRLAIPVVDQLPLAQRQQDLAEVAAPHLPELRHAVSQLQRDWQSRADAPAWEQVAHSLLVNYLLWSVGGQMLLKLCGATAATALVNRPGESDAIWQGFVRYNQQYGASYLLGARYENSAAVRDLLNRDAVVKTMATLSEDRRLTVSESSARRYLNSLCALAGGRAEDGSERTAWPVLSARDLRDSKALLVAVSIAMRPLIQHAAAAATDTAGTEMELFVPSDIALVAYGLLAKIAADDWIEAGLLPEPVHPVIGT